MFHLRSFASGVASRFLSKVFGSRIKQPETFATVLERGLDEPSAAISIFRMPKDLGCGTG